jgi:hypothetical protein
MIDIPQRPPLPHRVSVDPRSPNHAAAVLEHAIDIRLNDTERKGHPLPIELKGKVEAFHR